MTPLAERAAQSPSLLPQRDHSLIECPRQDHPVIEFQPLFSFQCCHCATPLRRSLARCPKTNSSRAPEIIPQFGGRRTTRATERTGQALYSRREVKREVSELRRSDSQRAHLATRAAHRNRLLFGAAGAAAGSRLLVGWRRFKLEPGAGEGRRSAPQSAGWRGR